MTSSTSSAACADLVRGPHIFPPRRSRHRGLLRAAVAVFCAACLGVPAASVGLAQPLEIRWRQLPAGTFDMGCVPSDLDCAGDERPRHAVTLSKAFELMTTEITVGLFQAYAATSGIPMPPLPPWNREERSPMLNISWDEAARFCRWAGGRLPTEAEWEFGARAGRPDAILSWGSGAPVVGGKPAANVADDAAKLEHPEWTTVAGFRDGYAFTAPVASFQPNAYGLYDMSGNVSEWVADWYRDEYYRESPERDPAGPAAGAGRVVRGGSWADFSRGLRLSHRSIAGATARGIDIGARCARDFAAGAAAIEWQSGGPGSRLRP